MGVSVWERPLDGVADTDRLEALESEFDGREENEDNDKDDGEDNLDPTKEE